MGWQNYLGILNKTMSKQILMMNDEPGIFNIEVQRTSSFNIPRSAFIITGQIGLFFHYLLNDQPHFHDQGQGITGHVVFQL